MREVHRCHNLWKWYMKSCHCPRHLRFSLEMRRLVQESLRSILALMSNYFLILFMAVLGLRFCARAFSSCGERGPRFIAVRGPFTIAASLVAEHRLQTRRLSSCGSRAQLLRGMWDLPRPGLEPASPALAGRFSTTAPPGKPCPIIFNSLYSWACFLNFSSLQPFLDLKDTLLVFPLRQQQAFMHSFIYATYSWNKHSVENLHTR